MVVPTSDARMTRDFGLAGAGGVVVAETDMVLSRREAETLGGAGRSRLPPQELNNSELPHLWRDFHTLRAVFSGAKMGGVRSK
ncbi:hypothetical protein GCM10008097_07970 [Mycetocola manganoxydans]|nr:hypothetical protein GCM10008097_07970 [Mycetocola manganoxydans]